MGNFARKTFTKGVNIINFLYFRILITFTLITASFWTDAVVTLNNTSQSLIKNAIKVQARTIVEKLSDVISVKDFGAVGDGIHDDTAAIQTAFDAVLSTGNTNTITNTLHIPLGNYKVTALTLGYIATETGSAATKDLYHKNIVADGKLIGTNENGAVLTIEGIVEANIYGLRVINTSNAIGSIAVKTARSYAVNWYGGQFEGGETAFQLQGNNNNFFGSKFVNAGTGFLITGNTANSMNNTLWGCDIERNNKYGINVNRTGGALPSLAIRGSYFETTATSYLADIRINNATDIIVDNNYFAFNTGHDGIVYAGSIVPATPKENRNTVINNIFNINKIGLSINCLAREAGTADTFMRFVRYSNNSILGNINPNTTLGTTATYAGSTNLGMVYAINLDGLRRAVCINNFDFSRLSAGIGSAPTEWISGDGETIKSGVTVSPYGYGNKLIKTGQYVYQDIKLKPSTLYYLSVWANVDKVTSSAQMQLWDTNMAEKKADSTNTSNSTPSLLEGWYFNTSNTTLKLLLRNTSNDNGNVSFSEVRLIDYTN